MGNHKPEEKHFVKTGLSFFSSKLGEQRMANPFHKPWRHRHLVLKDSVFLIFSLDNHTSIFLLLQGAQFEAQGCGNPRKLLSGLFLLSVCLFSFLYVHKYIKYFYARHYDNI